MNNENTAHAGIELDTLDFSIDSTLSNTNNGQSFSTPEKIDPKEFVTQLIKKAESNQSFLSFSGQVENVNKILNTMYSSANDIANVIIKDAALTAKLLSLVNSTFYGHFGKKGIRTVSEAMIILGTEEIRLAAASLKIYEFMQDIANIKVLKQKTLKALQRSMIARQIAKDKGISDAEAVQISAMIYEIGQYLVSLFYPMVYIKIEIFAEENNIPQNIAARSVIGVSYNLLSRVIASKWHLPDAIVRSMLPVKDFNIPKSKLDKEMQMRFICSYVNNLCSIDINHDKKSVGQDIVQLSKIYKKGLNIPAADALKLLQTSWQKIVRHATLLGVSTARPKNGSCA